MKFLKDCLSNLSRLLMVVTFTLVGSFGTAVAGDITEYANGPWVWFGFIGQEWAVGSYPQDPDGSSCSYSYPDIARADAPPWTLDVGEEGATVTLLDASLTNDQFELFDHGISLGLTSDPVLDQVCGGTPEECLGDPNASQGVFDLAPGNHSLTIRNVNLTYGCAWFRVDGDVVGGVPEQEVDVYVKARKIRLDEDALIPVVVLSNPEFDARLIDRATVQFGPDGASPIGVSKWNDQNKDGLRDLYMRFLSTETGIQCEDTEARLTGTYIPQEGEEVPIYGIAEFITRCK